MDQEDRDMLIRIDQKVIAIDKVLSAPPSYGAIVEKVKTHGRLIWGIVTLSIAATIRAFWGD